MLKRRNDGTPRPTDPSRRRKPADKSVLSFRLRAVRTATITAILAISVCDVAFAAPTASITGGAETNGPTYSWTLTNSHDAPIVDVRFPHYHATLFFAPDGWTTKSTFLVNVGVEDRPGDCTAAADSPAKGIVRGGNGKFRMQINQRGTQRGRGTVYLRFADGAKLDLPGVEVPVPEGLGDKYVSLIGLGGIAAVFLLVRAWRGRHKARPN
jgi:hypothetical protein